MRIENIVIGLIFFGAIISITGLWYADVLEEGKYNTPESDSELFESTRLALKDIYRSEEEMKDDVFGQQVEEVTGEGASIKGAFDTAKTTFSTVQIAQNTTTQIAKKAGWKGVPTLTNYFILSVGILFLVFVVYFLRGFRPTNRG